MLFKNILTLTLFTLLNLWAYSQESTHLSSLVNEYKNEIKNDNLEQASLMAYEIGIQYISFKEPRKAINYFEKAIEHGLSNPTTLHSAYIKTGTSYLSLGKNKQAIAYLELAVSLAEKLNGQRLLLVDFIALGIAQERHKKYRDALNSIENAAGIALKINDIDLSLHCYDLLIQIAKKSKKHKKAAYYQEQYASFDKALTAQALSVRDEQLSESQTKANEFEQKQLQTASELHETNEELIKTSWELFRQEEELTETKKVTEKQAASLDVLSKQKEIDRLKIREMKAEQQVQAWIRNSIILMVIALTAVAFFIFRDYKHQKKAKEAIELQKHTIEHQKNEIEAEHEKMKSSINYAQRIQQAALPMNKLIEAQLPDSFVFFQPRDVVSGDFYWYYDPIESSLASEEFHVKQDDHRILMAAIDCTGHGVPGAFMSMIAFNLLSRIVGRGIVEPHDILNKLNKEVRLALKQSDTNNLDGMDMAICSIDKKNNKVIFSGAKNPLVYIRNGVLTYIKGDKHPIGGAQTKAEIHYVSHQVDIEKGDVFYMYSDGVIDQFGGDQGRKFMSKRFKQLLLDNHHLPMKEQKEIISRAMSDYMGDEYKQLDDMLVLGFRV
jgi:serine phosphatase RsbU (regulator of sigma subunit)